MHKENNRYSEKVILDEGLSISKDDPTCIVAEAACNHLCDMKLALRMIDEAAAAGADAIKFQTYKAEKLVTADAVAFWGDETISQIDYYRRLDRFGRREYEELFSYAQEKDILAFSSPFDFESADMLYEIGMKVFKIASCEIPNLHFIRHVAGFGRPIMLSVGASTPEEIDTALETILSQGNRDIILMACTLSYPTAPQDANLRRIQTLKERYPGILLGHSDHTEPDEQMVIPSLAVALGARVLEKHYTLDRTMTGSGHFFAVDPVSLKKMVQNIRLTELVLGNGHLGVEPSEQKAWASARRSIVAEVPIAGGTKISFDMLGFKRPADGLMASQVDQVVGKRARCDIGTDEKIQLDMLQDCD